MSVSYICSKQYVEKIIIINFLYGTFRIFTQHLKLGGSTLFNPVDAIILTLHLLNENCFTLMYVPENVFPLREAYLSSTMMLLLIC